MATLQNLIPSFPWIVPGWRAGPYPRKGRDQFLPSGNLGRRGAEPTKHGYTTNNARIEGVAESKLYRGAVGRGQRCVVICDGEAQQKFLYLVRILHNS